jgi:hypothetical protein
MGFIPPLMNKASKDMVGIYRFSSISTEIVFVGSSPSLGNALQKNINALIGRTHHCFAFQRLWDESEPDDFQFSIIEIVSNRDALLQREKYWIQELHAVSIDNKTEEDFMSSCEACTHISIGTDVRDSLKALSKGTMIEAVRFLIGFYREHSSPSADDKS